MKNQARIFWITGLSGSGKTTLAGKLVNYLKQQELPVLMLDGDELRAVLNVRIAHGREQRKELAMQYARLCKMIVSQDINVVIATISMFKEVHEWNRKNLPGYIEIFLDVPLDELIRRDPKQIYARAATGELKDVAGVDFVVDRPASPDVHLQWNPGVSVDDLLFYIIKKI